MDIVSGQIHKPLSDVSDLVCGAQNRKSVDNVDHALNKHVVKMTGRLRKPLARKDDVGPMFDQQDMDPKIAF